jgi:hypothetical protein
VGQLLTQNDFFAANPQLFVMRPNCFVVSVMDI